MSRFLLCFLSFAVLASADTVSVTVPGFGQSQFSGPSATVAVPQFDGTLTGVSLTVEDQNYGVTQTWSSPAEPGTWENSYLVGFVTSVNAPGFMGFGFAGTLQQSGTVLLNSGRLAGGSTATVTVSTASQGFSFPPVPVVNAFTGSEMPSSLLGYQGTGFWTFSLISSFNPCFSMASCPGFGNDPSIFLVNETFSNSYLLKVTYTGTGFIVPEPAYFLPVALLGVVLGTAIWRRRQTV